MIVNDKDAAKRLNSPMNLMNKLKDISGQRKNAMSLFIRPSVDTPAKEIKEIKTTFNPFEKNETKEVEIVTKEKEDTTIGDILNDSDNKIKLAHAHDKALQLLTDSVSALAAKLDDVKADKLPAVITAASKTVESIRRERLEATKNNKDREVHYHFYTPAQKKLTDYEVIEVSANGT